MLAVSPRGTGAVLEGDKEGSGVGARAIVSLANLTATLRASKPSGTTSVGFRGTAADLNLEDWSISVRPEKYRSIGPGVVVARSRAPVVDGPLASWMPPRPGLYEATLTVRDLAGNVGTARTLVPWNQSSLIADLRAEPSLFSARWRRAARHHPHRTRRSRPSRAA